MPPEFSQNTADFSRPTETFQEPLEPRLGEDETDDGLSESEKRKRLKERVADQEDVDPSEVTISKEGGQYKAKLSKSVLKERAAEKLNKDLPINIGAGQVALSEDGATLTESARKKAQKQSALDTLQEQTETDITAEDIVLTENGATLSEKAAQNEALAENINLSESSFDVNEKEVEQDVARQLGGSYRYADDITVFLQDDGSVNATVEGGYARGATYENVAQTLDFVDLNVPEANLQGSQFVTGQRFDSASDLQSFLTERGISQENVSTTTFQGNPAAFIRGREFQDGVPDPFAQLRFQDSVTVAPAEKPELSDEETQQLKEQAAADTEFAPSAFTVSAGFGQAQAQLREGAVDQQREQQRQQAVTQLASELTDASGFVVTPDDIGVNAAGFEISDSARKDLVAGRLSQRFDTQIRPYEVSVSNDVATLNESAKRQIAKAKLDSRTTENVLLSEVNVDGNTATVETETGTIATDIPSAETASGVGNVSVNTALPLPQQNAPEQERKRAIADAVSADTNRVIQPRNIILQDNGGYRLADQARRNLATNRFNAQINRDVEFTDVNVTDSGAKLDNLFRRETVAQEFNTDTATEIGAEDIQFQDGGATLTQEAIQKEFAANFNQDSETDIDQEDVEIQDGTPQLTGQAESRVTQAQRSEFLSEISENNPISRRELSRDQIQREGDTLTLSEGGQRAIAAAQVQEQTGLDVSASEITLGDGPTLNEDTRAQLAAQQFSERTGANIGASDITLTGDSARLSERGQRAVVAQQFEDEVDGSVDLDADDVQRTEGGFELDPSAQIRFNRANPNFEGFADRDFSAEIDQFISEVDAADSREDVTVERGTIRLTEQAQRESAAQQLEQTTDLDTVDPQDIVLRDGQAEVQEGSTTEQIFRVQAGREAEAEQLQSLTIEQPEREITQETTNITAEDVAGDFEPGTQDITQNRTELSESQQAALQNTADSGQVTDAPSTSQAQAIQGGSAQAVNELTTGGFLSEDIEEGLNQAAARYSDAAQFVGGNVGGAVDTVVRPITGEEGETTAGAFTQGAVTSAGEIGNVPAFVSIAESGTEAAQGTVTLAREGQLTQALAAGGELAGQTAESFARSAQETPARFVGSLAGAVGASAGAGFAAGRGIRFTRQRVRTAGSETFDISSGQIVNTETGRVFDPSAETPSDAFVRQNRFPGAIDADLYQRRPAEAIRQQADEFTPESVNRQFESAGVTEGTTLKKAIEVEPDGSGGGFRTQAGEFESPGAFAGPELSPNFLRLSEQRSFSLRPGVPDAGDQATGVFIRTDVESTDADNLVEFNRELRERAGETTARTKPESDLRVGEAEAIIPPEAQFADAANRGTLSSVARRVGIGSDFSVRFGGRRIPFTDRKIGGRKVPIRAVADPDKVDTGSQSRLRQLVSDERAQLGARTDADTDVQTRQLSEIRRPLTQPTDRPSPIVGSSVSRSTPDVGETRAAQVTVDDDSPSPNQTTESESSTSPVSQPTSQAATVGLTSSASSLTTEESTPSEASSQDTTTDVSVTVPSFGSPQRDIASPIGDGSIPSSVPPSTPPSGVPTTTGPGGPSVIPPRDPASPLPTSDAPSPTADAPNPQAPTASVPSQSIPVDRPENRPRTGFDLDFDADDDDRRGLLAGDAGELLTDFRNPLTGDVLRTESLQDN